MKTIWKTTGPECLELQQLGMDGTSSLVISEHIGHKVTIVAVDMKNQLSCLPLSHLDREKTWNIMENRSNRRDNGSNCPRI
jgi:hypothetical protein